MVLEPRFTATILGIVAGMLSGELVVKGRTPFGDRVGEAIATEALTMFDDPTDPDSLSASAFDGEGLACRRVPLISEGVLQDSFTTLAVPVVSGCRRPALLSGPCAARPAPVTARCRSPW